MYVLGSAIFDKELKRILLTFDHIRTPKNETSYALKATGLAPNGQVGLEGDYHTQEGIYFAGEILAATAAGYADATNARWSRECSAVHQKLLPAPEVNRPASV